MNLDFLKNLSPLQERLLRATFLLATFVVFGWLVFQIFKVLALFVSSFSIVLWPLAIATVLALLLRPVVSAMTQALPIPKAGAVLIIFAAGGGLLVLIGFQLPAITNSAVAFIKGLPELVTNVLRSLEERLPAVARFLQESFGGGNFEELTKQAQRGVQQYSQNIVQGAQALGQNLLGLTGNLVGIAVIPVYLFFFLLMEQNVLAGLNRQLGWMEEDHRKEVLFLIQEFMAIIMSFFRGQLLIALLIAVFLTIAFSIIDLEGALILGPVLGLLNVVPFLGHILGLIITLPVAYFQDDGGLVLMLITLAVFTAAQSLDSYILQPWILGNRTGLHPVVVIVSVFFWGNAIGGILGLILAVPLTAFFVVVWRLIRKKYLEDEDIDPEAARREAVEG
jgi:predicted PurR-regulated permease PerM